MWIQNFEERPISTNSTINEKLSMCDSRPKKEVTHRKQKEWGQILVPPVCVEEWFPAPTETAELGQESEWTQESSEVSSEASKFHAETGQKTVGWWEGRQAEGIKAWVMQPQLKPCLKPYFKHHAKVMYKIWFGDA